MKAPMKAIYSPPPEVIGSFCQSAAENAVISGLTLGDLDDKTRVRLTARGVGIHIARKHKPKLTEFEPFYFFAEPTQPLVSFREVETWHYDQGDDASPIPIIFGATVKVSDVVSGYFHVPCAVLTEDPEDLANYVSSDDGQAGIEADIQAGNLEPVTTISPGDLALFDIYALHKRCTFLPEEAGGIRVSIHAFGLD